MVATNKTEGDNSGLPEADNALGSEAAWDFSMLLGLLLLNVLDPSLAVCVYSVLVAAAERRFELLSKRFRWV